MCLNERERERVHYSKADWILMDSCSHTFKIVHQSNREKKQNHIVGAKEKLTVFY